MITSAIFPAGDGVRVDTHVESGTRVPPFYDSLLAKIITRGADREDSVVKMTTALANCHIEGVASNVAMQAAILADLAFKRGGVDTAWLAGWLPKSGAHAAQV